MPTIKVIVTFQIVSIIVENPDLVIYVSVGDSLKVDIDGRADFFVIADTNADTQTILIERGEECYLLRASELERALVTTIPA